MIDERVSAVRSKPPAPLVDRQADDIVIFDVLPPLVSRGTDAVARKTQAWFDAYASDIAYDVEEVEIHAGDDVAFCSFAYHVGGTLTSGDVVDMWVRATLGLRRTGGAWRIVHDHESVPWDPQTGRGVIDRPPAG